MSEKTLAQQIEQIVSDVLALHAEVRMERVQPDTVKKGNGHYVVGQSEELADDFQPAVGGAAVAAAGGSGL